MSRALPLAVLVAFAAWPQEPAPVKLQLLAKGYTFTEGPAWSKDGYLIFSDTPMNRLLKWVPGADAAVFREDAHGPCGNAFDSQGRLYTCESRARRVTRTDKNGKIDIIAEAWDGKHFNGPSHIAIGRGDQVYFTDPAFGYQADRRELDFYGVYHLPPKGPLKLAAKLAGRPTGIALAPNGRTLYVADADQHAVRAYDLDRAGDVSKERTFVSALPAPPAGLFTDTKGRIFVAAGAIAVYSPEGSLLRRIELHEMPSACALGEADLRTLFITARGSVYRARLDETGQ